MRGVGWKDGGMEGWKDEESKGRRRTKNSFGSAVNMCVKREERKEEREGKSKESVGFKERERETHRRGLRIRGFGLPTKGERTKSKENAHNRHTHPSTAHLPHSFNILTPTNTYMFTQYTILTLSIHKAPRLPLLFSNRQQYGHRRRVLRACLHRERARDREKERECVCVLCANAKGVLCMRHEA